MTPEQNEQWQKAISPLDYLDFHALTENGLHESEERLQGWGVPGWAMQLRGHLITLGWKTHETWTPGFALHAETALIGLQLQHPASKARVEVYRRILLRFLHEALSPIVEWALEGDDVRRNGYQGVAQVNELCQSLLLNPSSSSAADRLAWNQAMREIMIRKGRVVRDEINSSVELATYILFNCQDLVFPPEHWQTWWSQLRRQEVTSLVRELHRHHYLRLDEKGDAAASYEQIANAYLSALEAECPPPDWI